MENLFERATRARLRFQTTKGVINTEDLWTLPLRTLNELAQGLHGQLKTIEDKIDFLNTEKPKKEDSETALAFEVVKYVLLTKKRENEETAMAAERREKKQNLMALIQQKKEGELANKSVAELEEMIASL